MENFETITLSNDTSAKEVINKAPELMSDINKAYLEYVAQQYAAEQAALEAIKEPREVK